MTPPASDQPCQPTAAEKYQQRYRDDHHADCAGALGGGHVLHYEVEPPTVRAGEHEQVLGQLGQPIGLLGDGCERRW